MAKIRFGPIVGDARRSIEAITYSRNRYGAYTRKRTAPVQPRTPLQVATRETLTGIITTWRQRSADEQHDWATLGSQIIRTDSMGQTYNLTGAQAYASLNITRATAGLPPLFSPPPLVELPPFALLTATYSGGAWTSLNLEPDLPGPDRRYRIWAAKWRSPGIRFVRPRDYRLLLVGATNASVESPAALGALTAAYNAAFGSAPPGTFIPLAADLMSNDGFVTELVRLRVIAT